MKYILKKKTDSWVMEALGIVLGPKFTEDFWTTWIPLWGTPIIFTPSHYDANYNVADQASARNWFEVVHREVAQHEFTHIEQARKWTPLGLYLLYVGPAPFLMGAAAVCAGISALSSLSWSIPLIIAILSVLSAPLSIGLAWGRWRIEREPYLAQIRARPSRLEWVVRTLHEGYMYSWPRSWMRAWFKKELTK